MIEDTDDSAQFDAKRSKVEMSILFEALDKLVLAVKPRSDASDLQEPERLRIGVRCRVAVLRDLIEVLEQQVGLRVRSGVSKLNPKHMKAFSLYSKLGLEGLNSKTDVALNSMEDGGAEDRMDEITRERKLKCMKEKARRDTLNEQFSTLARMLDNDSLPIHFPQRQRNKVATLKTAIAILRKIRSRQQQS